MQRQTRKTKAPWAVLLALFLLATAVFPTAAWASAQQDPSASEEVTYLDTVSVSPDADLEEGMTIFQNCTDIFQAWVRGIAKRFGTCVFQTVRTITVCKFHE